jgi:hypothetical protein
VTGTQVSGAEWGRTARQPDKRAMRKESGRMNGHTASEPSRHCFRAKQINIRGSRNLFFFLFLTDRAAPIEPRPDRSYRRKPMLDHYVFRLTVQRRIIFTQPRTEGVPASNSNSTGEVCTANTSHFAKEKCYHEATKQSVNIRTRETVTTRTLE